MYPMKAMQHLFEYLSHLLITQLQPLTTLPLLLTTPLLTTDKK